MTESECSLFPPNNTLKMAAINEREKLMWKSINIRLGLGGYPPLLVAVRNRVADYGGLPRGPITCSSVDALWARAALPRVQAAPPLVPRVTTPHEMATVRQARRG